MKPTRSDDPVFTPELNALLRQYAALEADQPRRQALRTKIVALSTPYVQKLARALARRNTDPVDDIMQVGHIGLMKAIEKFDPTAGSSFKTYATYLITGEIRHYLRDKTSMIKAPRQLYELYYRVNQIVQQLSGELGRTPTDVEIAERLQCPVSQVNQAKEADRRSKLVSLDQFMTPDQNDTTFVETLVDHQYFEVAACQENRIVLDEAMGHLKEDLRVVVQLTYFEDQSQAEIARRLGISQMQVSRRLRKALDLLSKDLALDAALG